MIAFFCFKYNMRIFSYQTCLMYALQLFASENVHYLILYREKNLLPPIQQKLANDASELCVLFLFVYFELQI